jgi:hypothetical protein
VAPPIFLTAGLSSDPAEVNRGVLDSGDSGRDALAAGTAALPGVKDFWKWEAGERGKVDDILF